MFKQILATLMLAFVVFSMSSCIKRYHCLCYIDYGSGVDEPVDYETLGTRKTAEADCKEEDESNKAIFAGDTYCTLR
ncbi:MAG: hypothetical protein KDC07_06760 [Chitinophagaceae bacterium]|nr:hypothetical protein [Chitinophagaceae bacterium]MCB9045173.1 hypothetical protein [Chitinophagales bacterium]